MATNNNDVRLVGKRSSAPLWLLLALLALVIGALLWWLNDDTRETLVNLTPTTTPTTTPNRLATTTPTTTPATNPNEVRDIAGLLAVRNIADVHNQNVGFDGVRVAEVLNDRLFYVDQGVSGQRLLVRLNDEWIEQLAEDEVTLAVGQQMDLDGELKVVAEENLVAGNTYTAAEIQQLRNQPVFLQVSDVNLKQ